MLRKPVCILSVLVLVAGFFVAACGGGGGASSGLKVLTVVPGSGSIMPATLIAITFNSSMDTSTLSLSGDMEPECDGGVWSTSALADDTLTISPDPGLTGTWIEEVGKTLTIDVDDVDARSLATLTLTYTVDGAPPQVVAYTDNASPIMENTDIIVEFSESMDRGSLVLGGLMAGDVHMAVWSSTLISDDTVTINPTGFWTMGTGRNITLDASDLAGNSLTTLDVTYEIVAAPLLAAVSPPNWSVLGGTSDIVVVFSETMDTSTVVLTGTLISDPFSTAWSTTSYADDTLTISPSGTWTGGFGSTLSVEGESLSGKVLTTLNLTYDVGIVHVSMSSGMDSNTGSRALPMRTIQAGVDIAYLQSVDTVLVETGSYSEAVVLAEGVNIQGGYDASWALSPSGTTRITGGLSTTEGKYISVEASDVSLSTTVTNLTISGPTPPSGFGESSWAVHVVDSTGVILDNVELIGGIGGTGAAGTAGSNATQTKAPAGAVGGNPGSPGSCSEAYGSGGAAGTTGDSRSGGAGGNGGQADTSCGSNYTATPGATGSHATTFGSGYGTGGAGGGTGVVGQAGVAGQNGAPGTPGDGGLAGEGLFDTSTLGWDPGGIATNGLSDGTMATGGGGGGGAGGAGNDAGGTYGGGGGGGGGGGLNVGAGGSGGSGGGASMALFAANSSVTLNSVTITIGTGGRGGGGGAGGLGQPGGNGGAGGDTGGGPFGRELAGGNGGVGGRAGQGGGGGGGAGGDAFGFFTYNANIVETDVIIQGGTAGTGGNGGSPNGNVGENGALIQSYDQP